MEPINWKRVAKPQPDGYDSYVIGSFLKDKYGWVKTKPTSGYTLCDGHVSVVPDPYHKKISDIINNNYEGASQLSLLGAYEIWNDTRAAALTPYLSSWHDGYEMLKLFLDQFWPLITYINIVNNKEIIKVQNATLDEIIEQVDSSRSRGCSSGHYNLLHHKPSLPNFVNAVYVTIQSHQGCAEGIYHEVGHGRLNAINLEIEQHDGRLFSNTKDELYESPIRRDKKRPLSAVIQAIYSWIILSENDLQCAKITGNAPESAEYLINNLPKIEDGIATIRQHIKCTSEGIDFFDGYFEWAEDVCARARTLCKEQFGDEYTLRYNKSCEYKIRQPIGS